MKKIYDACLPAKLHHENEVSAFGRKKVDIKPKQKKAAELICNPDFDGDITGLCRKVKIAQKTFYAWFQDETFRNYIEEIIDKRTYDEVASVWQALLEQCIKGNVPAIKLFFDLLGKRKNDGKITVRILDDIPKD